MDLIRRLSPRNIFEFTRKSAPRTVVIIVHHCVSILSYLDGFVELIPLPLLCC